MSEVRPINERVAAVEEANKISSQDRRDLWEMVNQLRALPVKIDAMQVTLEEVKALCEDKERRLSAIEDGKLLATGERNALARIGAGVLGLCTVIGAAIAVLVNLPKWTGHQ